MRRATVILLALFRLVSGPSALAQSETPTAYCWDKTATPTVTFTPTAYCLVPPTVTRTPGASATDTPMATPTRTAYCLVPLTATSTPTAAPMDTRTANPTATAYCLVPPTLTRTAYCLSVTGANATQAP